MASEKITALVEQVKELTVLEFRTYRKSSEDYIRDNNM